MKKKYGLGQRVRKKKKNAVPGSLPTEKRFRIAETRMKRW